MLKISRLADYSLIILHCLAEEPAQSFSAAKLAVKTHLSRHTVSKLLKKLTEVSLLNSARGAGGGYCLAKDPRDISLLEIIEAIDGLPAMTDCAREHYQCVHDRFCQLRGNWQIINQAIYRVFATLTLADMRQPLTINKVQQPLVNTLSLAMPIKSFQENDYANKS